MSQPSEELAHQLHQAWQAAWRREHGGERRMKPVKQDQQWIRRNGTNEVDIAATEFKDLPIDWQAENLASAKAAIDIVQQLRREGKSLNDEATLEEASARLHVNWLSRNGSWASAVQRRPYDRLPEEERQKDRVVIRLAAQLVG
jgi:hypothetical protein